MLEPETQQQQPHHIWPFLDAHNRCVHHIVQYLNEFESLLTVHGQWPLIKKDTQTNVRPHRTRSALIHKYYFLAFAINASQLNWKRFRGDQRPASRKVSAIKMSVTAKSSIENN